MELGGSAVNNLADNVQLFGLERQDQLLRRTYTIFARHREVAVPDALAGVITRSIGVVDLSYLQELAQTTQRRSR